MSKLQGAWIWYELLTTDPTAAKAFYEAVVGWQITLGEQAPLHYGMIARPDGGMTGGVLPLTEEMLAKGAHTGWLGYIGVDDVEATLATICAAGGKVLMPVMEIDEGRFALATDADGAPFYLMTPKGAEGASTAFSSTTLGACSWNELCAANIEAARPLYAQVFGWEEVGAMDMGPMGQYRFLAHADERIGAMMPLPEGCTAAHWNHYFRVADIDHAATAIGDMGGEIVHGPHEVPGGDWILHGIDPQGGHFCVVGARG